MTGKALVVSSGWLQFPLEQTSTLNLLLGLPATVFLTLQLWRPSQLAAQTGG